MRVLVTGGAGFIGSNVVRHLLSQGHDPVVLDDLSTGFKSNLDGLGISLIEGSVVDRDLVLTAMRGTDAVVHLAALGSVSRSLANPGRTHAVNVEGTLSVLDAARALGNIHVVYASSSSVYGGNLKLPKTENDWVAPLSPYAAGKLAAEQYSLSYQASFSLPVLALRFFNVYGPRQSPGAEYPAVIPRFLEAALSGQPAQIYGDGLQSRDFTYVHDVSRVIVGAVERRISPSRPVNLAFGRRVSLLELISEIGSVLNRKIEIVHLPERAADVRHSEAVPDTVLRFFPDVSPTNLAVGLGETVEWFMGTIGDTPHPREGLGRRGATPV